MANNRRKYAKKTPMKEVREMEILSRKLSGEAEHNVEIYFDLIDRFAEMLAKDKAFLNTHMGIRVKKGKVKPKDALRILSKMCKRPIKSKEKIQRANSYLVGWSRKQTPDDFIFDENDNFRKNPNPRRPKAKKMKKKI